MSAQTEVKTNFKDQRSAPALALAKRAFESGNHERALQVLAEIDGYEAWSGVLAGVDSRRAVTATITLVRKAQRKAASARMV